MQKLNEVGLDFYAKLKLEENSSQFFYQNWKKEPMMATCFDTFKLLTLDHQDKLVQSMKQLAKRENNEMQKKQIKMCHQWLSWELMESYSSEICGIRRRAYLRKIELNKQSLNFLRCIQNGGMSGKLFYEIWRNSDSETKQNLIDSFCFLSHTQMLVLIVKIQQLTLYEADYNEKMHILCCVDDLRMLRAKYVVWTDSVRKIQKKEMEERKIQQQTQHPKTQMKLQPKARGWLKSLFEFPSFCFQFISAKVGNNILFSANDEQTPLYHRAQSDI